jgi:betaine reductase
MISAIPPVPQAMGVPRIVPGRAVTYLLGEPDLPPAEERALRRRIVETALRALATPVVESTTFEVM